MSIASGVWTGGPMSKIKGTTQSNNLTQSEKLYEKQNGQIEQKQKKRQNKITLKGRIHPFFGEGAILFPVLLLVGFGIIMVYSASSAIAMEKYNNHLYFMQRQVIFCLVSLGVMFTAASFPFRFLRLLAYPVLIFAMVLLCLVHVPSMGLTAGGACRWINLWGFTFQPAEFTKLALIIFLAYSLSKKQELIRNFSVGFMPHVLIFALLALLIMLQPDFGTVVILGMVTWLMMFIAGVPILHLLIPVPFLIPIIYFLVYKVDYRMNRILAFLNPWDDPLNTGYQITHSLKAFGSGGLFGKGIGMGMQKLHYLPEAHTDFIFSIIGEELGLIGVFLILFLFSVVLWRGAGIARRSGSLFGSFAAAGLTAGLGIQAIINMGVALGVLPTKGLTLPFLSYGGTSLLVNMTGMGILMNIGASTDDG